MDAALDKPQKNEFGQLPHAPINDWVTSPSTARHIIEQTKLLHVENPAAAGDFILVDENTLAEHMKEMGKPNMFAICVNTSGKVSFAREFGMHGYAATASPAFYEDMLAKIKKAAGMKGFRLIEVFAPCPLIWNNETSNTVELCRQAVNIGLWPLFEVEYGKVIVNYKPAKLESKSVFESMQTFMHVDESTLDANWRKFLLKPYEVSL